MLSNLVERSSEIGILKAVGGQRGCPEAIDGEALVQSLIGNFRPRGWLCSLLLPGILSIPSQLPGVNLVPAFAKIRNCFQVVRLREPFWWVDCSFPGFIPYGRRFGELFYGQEDGRMKPADFA